MQDSIQTFLAQCKVRITSKIERALTELATTWSDAIVTTPSQVATQNSRTQEPAAQRVAVPKTLVQESPAQTVLVRLAEFMRGGKMIRGALVRLGAELCGSQVPDDALDWAGAAMEFFQAGLLIHDDIMDRDTIRRGRSTVYWHYAQDAMHYAQHTVTERVVHMNECSASAQHDTTGVGADHEAAVHQCSYHNDVDSNELLHYGVAQGISAGDIAFFLGYYALQQCIADVHPAATGAAKGADQSGTAADTPAVIAKETCQNRTATDTPAEIAAGTGSLAFTALELCKVGLAQMLDVRNGSDFFLHEPSVEEILEVYRYKTGRYTFSLPLSLGAQLARAENSVCKALEAYGEQLGIVFQLKDDELGIFAPAEKLGKVLGADIRENKKTVHRYLLFNVPGLPQNIKNLFGKKNITHEELCAVQEAMHRYKIDSSVRQLMGEYLETAKKIRETLTGLEEQGLAWLKQLENYSLVREF